MALAWDLLLSSDPSFGRVGTCGRQAMSQRGVLSPAWAFVNTDQVRGPREAGLPGGCPERNTSFLMKSGSWK